MSASKEERKLKTKSVNQEKVGIITLGCSKNVVDSENIATQLSAQGYHVEHEGEDIPDVAVINTCGFIDLAKEESIQTILAYAELKKEDKLKKLYVTGCLSERYADDLRKEIPEVDAFFGTMELPQLLSRFGVDYKHELLGERNNSVAPHYAYLKISEGCNRTCSFCAIPLMRGGHISRPIEELVVETKNLVRRGVKEVMLIAQELTYYGLDLYKKRALSDLLQELVKIEGLSWIRLHYAYPHRFPLEVIDLMAQEPKICNYLDMPLQHLSDPVLSAMKRQISREESFRLVEEIRKRNPDIALRTTMLVGHPGETEKDYEELCQGVQELNFDRLGVFQYSHEEGTAAYDMKDNIPPEEKARRAEHLMAIQSQIVERKNAALVGQVMPVLVDRKEGDYFVGRTEYDSPDVDNEVLIDAREIFVRVGDFTEVEVVDYDMYDLIAVPVLK